MNSRIVAIGFDSPALGLVRSEVAAGRMPVLADLIRRGGFAPLVDVQALFTAPSWVTTLRGVPPPVHGLPSDRRLTPASYRTENAGGEHAGAPCFWRHAADAGARVVVMSPYSAGLESGIAGTQVVGWASHDPFAAKTGGPRSVPEELVRELDARFPAGGLRFGDTPPRTHGDLARLAERASAGIERQRAAMAWLMERDEWDLFVGSIGDCHPATHELLHLADPSHPEHEPHAPEAVRNALAELYRQADSAIGDLVARAGGDVTVFLFSPYDHRPDRHLAGVMSGWLERAGFLHREPIGATPPKARALALGRRVAHATIPASLRPLAGRLVPRDRWLEEIDLADVDWSASTVFPIPGDGSSSLRVNVVGREPNGAVDPTDRLTVIDELIAALADLRDADTGGPLVARAVPIEALWGSSPDGALPDVCVEWRDGPPPRAIRCPDGSELEVVRSSSRRSVHCPPGFLIGVGGGISASGTSELVGEPAQLVDVAATVLASIGVTGAGTGTPVERLLPAG